MATTALTRTSFTKTGIDLTAAETYASMTAGSGNGKTINSQNLDFIALYNTTGSTVTYTVKGATTQPMSDRSLTPPDMTVSVANGKCFIVPLSSLFIAGDTITVECSGTAYIAAILKPILD